jgi:hypothetical protein
VARYEALINQSPIPVLKQVSTQTVWNFKMRCAGGGGGRGGWKVDFVTCIEEMELTLCYQNVPNLERILKVSHKAFISVA